MRLSVPAAGYALAWQGDFGGDLPTGVNSGLSTRSEFRATLDASECAARGEYAPVTPELLRSVHQGLQSM